MSYNFGNIKYLNFILTLLHENIEFSWKENIFKNKEIKLLPNIKPWITITIIGLLHAVTESPLDCHQPPPASTTAKLTPDIADWHHFAMDIFRKNISYSQKYRWKFNLYTKSLYNAFSRKLFHKLFHFVMKLRDSHVMKWRDSHATFSS